METKRPNIGDIIYFTGYGMVEELKVYKITTEETADEFTSYIYANRRDGTTECIDIDQLGKLAFPDPLSADEALNGKANNSISSLQNTASVCTLQMNTFKGQCCPHCGESYYMENNSMSTCVYYPPIFKNGINVNPDRNKTTVNCTCMACGKEFSYTR